MKMKFVEAENRVYPDVHQASRNYQISTLIILSSPRSFALVLWETEDLHCQSGLIIVLIIIGQEYE